MRIAFVANNLRDGGGKTVMANFLPEFLELLGNTEHQILAVLPFKGAVACDFKNVELMHSPGNGTIGRFLWQKLAMEPAVRKFRPDWTFSMGNYAVNGLSGRQSVILHNSNIYSDFASSVGASYWIETRAKQIQFEKSLKSMDRLYFQTPVVERDFEKRFPNYAGKKAVIDFFLPKEIYAKPAGACANKRRGKTFDLIYPAHMSFHKNHKIIVDTFVKYREELSGVRCYLTLDKNWKGFPRELYNTIVQNGLESSVIYTGFLPMGGLFDLYEKCDALAMPTKLESLGIPYLEAMYFGLPIVTTDADFARAVCGDAALYCDTSSEESFRDAILKLRDSPETAAELVEKGRAIISEKVKSCREIAAGILELENIPFRRD